MDQLLPFLFTLLVLIVVLQVALVAGSADLDRCIRNTDLSRPRA